MGTKNIGLISRRINYGTIKANKSRKDGVTEVVEDFFWIRTKSIFQYEKS